MRQERSRCTVLFLRISSLFLAFGGSGALMHAVFLSFGGRVPSRNRCWRSLKYSEFVVTRAAWQGHLQHQRSASASPDSAISTSHILHGVVRYFQQSARFPWLRVLPKEFDEQVPKLGFLRTRVLWSISSWTRCAHVAGSRVELAQNPS